MHGMRARVIMGSCDDSTAVGPRTYVKMRANIDYAIVFPHFLRMQVEPPELHYQGARPDANHAFLRARSKTPQYMVRRMRTAAPRA
jgi:hypothetical protein